MEFFSNLPIPCADRPESAATSGNQQKRPIRRKHGLAYAYRAAKVVFGVQRIEVENDLSCVQLKHTGGRWNYSVVSFLRAAF